MAPITWSYLSRSVRVRTGWFWGGLKSERPFFDVFEGWSRPVPNSITKRGCWRLNYRKTKKWALSEQDPFCQISLKLHPFAMKTACDLSPSIERAVMALRAFLLFCFFFSLICVVYACVYVCMLNTFAYQYLLVNLLHRFYLLRRGFPFFFSLFWG